MAEGKILIGVILSTIISLFYGYYISSRIPKGKLRFISLIPIFYLFTILPLYFSSALATVITFITWLANFKLLLFCFDRGPLSSGQTKCLLIFIFSAALPCKIKQNKSHTSMKPKKKIPISLPIKGLLLAMFIAILHKSSQGSYINPMMVKVLYVFMIYLWLDVVIASATTVVQPFVGLELEPPSDEPHGNKYSPSHCIPTRKISLNWLNRKGHGHQSDRVFHFCHISFNARACTVRAPTTWEMGSLFLLHRACVVLEMEVKRAFADRCRLSPLVSTLLVVGFAIVTGVWLFFPPVVNNGIDVKFIEDHASLYKTVLELNQKYIFFG